MRLVIQIPCYNEAQTLPQVIADLPTKIPGIETIEVIIIDDGSSDQTAVVATQLGIKHVVTSVHNQGLAMAFKRGVDYALKLRADILVNTDGDNQYRGSDIAKLVKPIVDRQADVVIGERPIATHPEFSSLKKLLQKLGSWVVRTVAGVDVADVTSGFRAYSRESLLRMQIFSSFSYCLESIIQAGSNNQKIISVPIAINPKTRPSRLYRSLFQYLWKSAKTIIHIWFLYHSRYVFISASSLTFVVALWLVGRFLYRIYFLGSTPATFWPTIVLAGVLLIVSIQIMLTGVIASLISSNRKLSEEILYRLKKERGL